MIERQHRPASGRTSSTMLEAGSVAGMEFSAASVAAALRPDGGGGGGVLRRARASASSSSARSARASGRTGRVASRYAFVHALHRNTLYQRTSPGAAARRSTSRSASEKRPDTATARATSPPSSPRTSSTRATTRRAVRYLDAGGGDGDPAAREPRGGRLSRTRALDHRRAGFPTPSASPARSPSSSSSASPAGRWATCAPRSRASTALASYAREQGRAAEEARALLAAGRRALLDRSRPEPGGRRAGARARPRACHDEALQAHPSVQAVRRRAARRTA